MWAKLIVEKNAEIFKIEEAKRKEKAAKQSYWSAMWGSSEKKDKSSGDLIPQEQLDKLESNIREQLEMQDRIACGEFAQTMKSVPKMKVSFSLHSASVALVNED